MGPFEPVLSSLSYSLGAGDTVCDLIILVAFVAVNTNKTMKSTNPESFAKPIRKKVAKLSRPKNTETNNGICTRYWKYVQHSVMSTRILNHSGDRTSHFAWYLRHLENR